MTIKVLVNGAFGRMGTLACQYIEQDDALALVAKASHQDNLTDMLQKFQPDAVLDLTNAQSVFENSKLILEQQIRPIIGTSGLLPEQVALLKQIAQQNNTPGIIVPNFSIGAILMIKYAQEIAKHLPDAEIIELHHDGKLDSPSGTALRTAERISKAHKQKKQPSQQSETIHGARGATHCGIPIHAIRLPGLVAHQEIIFGGHYETLTLKHDTTSREAFMPGVLLACKKVMTLDELVVGLAHLL